MSNSIKTFYIESLGCNKNIVDSEIILSLLKERGYRRTFNIDEAENVIVNTCAFIDEAKEEAIDTIMSLSNCRKKGSRLIVTGCFPQIYHEEIIKNLPEVDALIGIGNLRSIVDAVETVNKKKDYPESRIIGVSYREYRVRKELLTLPGSAYVKISEGCSRTCSFCLIPVIKGEMRSRKEERVIEEAKELEESGIHELILTSQDTLSYGYDLGMKDGLKKLLRVLGGETSFDLIRLLYLRPDRELLENLEIFENRGVISYFDMPIQHVSKSILKDMNRTGSYESYVEIIKEVRERFPGAILRTSVIVGFPGEGEEDFQLLLQFVKEIKFNHLGVFTFSPQKETHAYSLSKWVNNKTQQERKMRILEVQKEISKEQLEKNIGKIFSVLIEERVGGENLYIGRSYHFAPEVDGVFVVKSNRDIKPGSIVRARVSWADSYDLHGEVL